MAAYADLYNTANDEAIFQPRCYVAAWLVAQDIIADSQASPQRKDWANTLMYGQLQITGQQLAFQALRDPTVATDLNNATDEEILTAVISRLDDLVKIG